MAKVKSIPSRNTLNAVVNDALSNLVSLEVCDESPPKYDIDIERLLNEDNISSYQQPVDKDDVKKYGNIVSSEHHISGNLPSLISVGGTCVPELLKGGDTRNKNSASMAPITSSYKNVVANDNISLDALAQNYLHFDENPQTSKDSCFDLDFTLEDLLSDIGGSSVSVKNSKPLNKNGDLNLSSLSFSLNNDYKSEIEHQKDVINDDLSILLDTSEIQQQSNSFSLADLANSHFINNLPSNANEYLKENSSSENSDDSQFTLLDNLQSIFSPGKSEINVLTIENGLPLALKNRNSLDVDGDDKMLHNCNVSDDEIVPDIDLSFCIKKPKSVPKDDFTFDTVSPESTDSGFDEIDSVVLNKCIPSFQDFVSFQSICPYEKEFKSPLTNPKQSLLSKAISCKSKLDKTKCEKLKKIRKELYNKYSSTELFHCLVPNAARSERIMDRSNQCWISSEVADQ